MSLGSKLYDLRKKKGLSQEQAAEHLGVSRQTISKWETDRSTPEFDKLQPISQLYEISLDELAGNSATAEKTEHVVYVPLRYHYEYKSETMIMGIPLVHVHLGRGLCRATGIVAVGNVAKGVVSVGLLSWGLLSVGILSVGLLAFGCFALGLLSVGCLSAGILAIGACALGYVAIGGVAVGVYALGGCAVASRVALGGYASASIAIGEHANGVIRFVTDSSFHGVSSDTVRQTILQEYPTIWRWVLNLISSLVAP